MKPPPTERWDRETTLVSQIAAGASLLAFLFYFRRGDLLLYGDAVAHINIARRVIDSQTPGLLQLGTVWLPLQHLLMVPFLFSDSAWRTGIASAIPSMCAYVFGAAAVFRLLRGLAPAADKTARVAAWLGAVIYVANPNLLYLQTTAMTESLYLALFIWSVVYFSEFVQAASDLPAKSALVKCGLCLAAACFTRYDGWLLASIMCVAVIVVVARHSPRIVTGRDLGRFFLLVVAGPLLWIGYNAAVYHNALEFANGPYSARSIEAKASGTFAAYEPGRDSLPVAFLYLMKSAEDNMVEGWAQKSWLVLLLAGIVVALGRRHWPLILLCLPLLIYPLSIAYGSVPIHLPEWWPFNYYNVRYGIEMLPAFAVFTALTVNFLLTRVPGIWQEVAIGGVVVALVAVSYGLSWRVQPICYREAWTNSRTRIAFETELASTLLKLPHDATLLMYLGDHVGALQQAGIPLRQAINEGNHHPWRKPEDAEGLWERALSDPKKYVDYVVAMQGDPVATQVEKRDLSSVVVIRTIGQPAATIYWTHRPPQ